MKTQIAKIAKKNTQKKTKTWLCSFWSFEGLEVQQDAAPTRLKSQRALGKGVKLKCENNAKRRMEGERRQVWVNHNNYSPPVIAWKT